MSEQPTKWSDLTPGELLDKAQEAVTFEMATVLVQAALVQAVTNLDLSGDRLGPTISNAIWEGLRTR